MVNEPTPPLHQSRRASPAWATYAVAAALGGSIPSGAVWFGGSRQSAEEISILRQRTERLEALTERIAGEQIERSNRIARLEAEGGQSTLRLSRIEEKLDRLLQGGK